MYKHPVIPGLDSSGYTLFIPRRYHIEEITVYDLLGSGVGDSERYLRQKVRQAAALAPSIILIDDLDALFPSHSYRPNLDTLTDENEDEEDGEHEWEEESKQGEQIHHKKKSIKETNGASLDSDITKGVEVSKGDSNDSGNSGNACNSENGNEYNNGDSSGDEEDEDSDNCTDSNEDDDEEDDEDVNGFISGSSSLTHSSSPSPTANEGASSLLNEFLSLLSAHTSPSSTSTSSSPLLLEHSMPVFFLATCSNPSAVHPLLRAPGRFDRYAILLSFRCVMSLYISFVYHCSMRSS